MNIFEFHFRLNGQEYYIYVDSSNEKNKKILINGSEVVNESCEMVFTRNAHIAYYPINIDGNEFVIMIDDSQFSHEYNVYLDDISLLDESYLNAKYNHAKDMVRDGFTYFAKRNWPDIFKKSLGALVIALLFLVFINDFNPTKIATITCLLILFLPLILILLVVAEWWYYKNIVSSYSKQFRPKKHYKTTNQGTVL